MYKEYGKQSYTNDFNNSITEEMWNIKLQKLNDLMQFLIIC